MLLAGIAVNIALLVREPARERMAASPLFRALFRALFREMRPVLVERESLLALAVFSFSGVRVCAVRIERQLAPDFGVSPNEVAWVTGLASGLSSAVGSFAGGFVCDRMNRLSAYGLCGFFAAAATAYLGLASHTPAAYACGFLGYAVANGFGYAAFTSLLLDTASLRKHGVATTYFVLCASGSLATIYMTALDGQATGMAVSAG